MACEIVEIGVCWENDKGKAILEFLCNFENESRPKSFWSKRLNHWWDENPYHKPEDPKGWVLISNSEVVGFLGVIGFEYYLNGKIFRALATTTWRVNKKHRAEAMNLYFCLTNLQQKYVILNTTPSPKVKEILQKLKYKSNNICDNYIFPIPKKGKVVKSLSWNIFAKFCAKVLPDKDLKVVDLNTNFKFEFSTNGNLLNRNTTKEYLQWYCKSPAMPKKFLGLTDKNNVLQAYIIAIKKDFNGTLAWRVIDYQSINHSIGLIYVLIRKIMKTPGILGDEGISFLILSILKGQNEVKKPLLIPNKRIETTHYYTHPDLLNNTEKRCVKAEGDYGL